MPKLKEGRTQWNIILDADLKAAVEGWIEINYGTLVPVGKAMEDILRTIIVLDGATWDDVLRFRAEVEHGQAH